MSADQSGPRLPSWQAAAILVLASPVIAQCGFDWQPGAPSSGPNATVWALTHASNGDLVAAGEFTVVDGVLANRVARWDGIAWQPAGAGLDGTAYTATRLPNGDLIVAGEFANAGGMPVNNIARWNGSSWSPLGGGVDGRVLALEVLANGDLVVGGQFGQAGGVAAARVARWDGSSWSALGGGLVANSITALAELPNGDLVVGGIGGFGTTLIGGLSRWDGVSWSPLPGTAGASNSQVLALAVLPNGDLAIAGNFVGTRVVLYDGTQLVPSAVPLNQVLALCVAANGDLIAGGSTLPGGSSVARRTAAGWITQSGGPIAVTTLLAVANGSVFAGGTPDPLTAPTANSIARLTSGLWTTLTAPRPPAIAAMQRLADGDVVVGGRFASIGGVAANNIARWNGSTWSPLGLGVDGDVTSLALAADGSLLVGGQFAQAGGSPAMRVARYDGAAWSTLGLGLNLTPLSMAANPAGEIVAQVSLGGSNSLRRFDGQVWSVLPPIPSSIVKGVVGLPSGEIYVGGLLFFPGGAFYGLGRYDGVGLVPVAASSNVLVGAMTLSNQSDLLVAVQGSPLSVRRLVGGSLDVVVADTLVGGSVTALTQLPNDDLVVGGAFVELAGQPIARIARWNGSSWSGIDGGVQNGSISHLAVSGHGELFASGPFDVAGGEVSSGLAFATPNCPASVVPFGAGCTGSAGPVTLTANGLPWAGATMHATARGMPPMSLALHLVGVTPIVQPLPLGAGGCSLFVDPVFLDLLFPTGNAVAAPFAIPNVASVYGQVVRTQVIGLELGAGLALVQTTGTNALELTVGAF